MSLNTPENPRRIGVWNTAFLGDAVLTLPLIANLKEAWPEAEIHYFVRKGLEDLFQAQPEITAVHAFDKQRKHRALSATIRYAFSHIAPLGLDLWVSAHASPRSAVVAIGSGAKTRIGYNKPFLNNMLYSNTVSRRFNELEEIERLLLLLAPLGLAPRHVWPELALSGSARLKADKVWSMGGLGLPGRPVMAVHPGSTWETKRWPEEYFSALLRDLLNEDLDIILLAGPDESNLAGRIVSPLEPDKKRPGRLFNLAGQLSLPELAAVISRLNLYVGNDSGPLHLAWTQRVPVVAVFGPTTRGLGFFPRGDSLVLERELPCRPCGLHGARHCRLGSHDCMKKISPEETARAVREKLFHDR